MNAPVALIGSPQDPHIDAVARGLGDAGVTAVIVDTEAFPSDLQITLTDALAGIDVDGVRLDRPASVYIRDFYASPLAPFLDVTEEMEQNWHRTMVALREKAQVLFALVGRWNELGVPIYNPPDPDWRLAKPLQLALLEQAGLPVPATLWTNDPAQVRAFANGRRIVYKPIAGGAATRELDPEDLTDGRLRKLSGAPVTFQELLPGDNYRVYCLDGEIVACIRITSQEIDFRQNEDIVEKTSLPDDVQAQCLKAAEVVNLRWTGMDLRDDGTGTLRFLELNSSPMFLGFDARAGTGVLNALVGALAAHAE